LLKHSIEEIYFPFFKEIRNTLNDLAADWGGVPMLARTHGQPASPTRLGKEIKVFVERLDNQLALLQQIPFKAKFGGATGNFNAHAIAYPAINWKSFGDHFVSEYLGLERMEFTTQIAHYDNIAATFQALKRINTILLDFCRDIWTYISMDYFKQKTIKGEIGSSAMPHKVNPIDFENAEGNLGIANAIFTHLADKLPISRLQRDLTDSTVLRNVGVPVGHTLIAFKSIKKGIGKLLLNETKLALLNLTRGKASVTQQDIHEFIDSLVVEAIIKEELKLITPHNYVGI